MIEAGSRWLSVDGGVAGLRFCKNTTLQEKKRLTESTERNAREHREKRERKKPLLFLPLLFSVSSVSPQ
jgi:hypothetical protein